MKVTTLLFAALTKTKRENLRKMIVFLLVCRRFMKRFSEVLNFIKLVQHEATGDFFIFFPYVQRCSGSLAVCFYLKSVFLAPVRSVICTLGKKLFIKLPTPQERGLIERHSSKMETSSRPILRAGPSCEITFTLAVMSRTGSPVGSWTERSCEKTHESLQTSCRRPVESRSVSRQWWTQHQLSHC